MIGQLAVVNLFRIQASYILCYNYHIAQEQGVTSFIDEQLVHGGSILGEVHRREDPQRNS